MSINPSLSSGIIKGYSFQPKLSTNYQRIGITPLKSSQYPNETNYLQSEASFFKKEKNIILIHPNDQNHPYIQEISNLPKKPNMHVIRQFLHVHKIQFIGHSNVGNSGSDSSDGNCGSCGGSSGQFAKENIMHENLKHFYSNNNQEFEYGDIMKDNQKKPHGYIQSSSLSPPLSLAIDTINLGLKAGFCKNKQKSDLFDMLSIGLYPSNSTDTSPLTEDLRPEKGFSRYIEPRTNGETKLPMKLSKKSKKIKSRTSECIGTQYDRLKAQNEGIVAQIDQLEAQFEAQFDGLGARINSIKGRNEHLRSQYKNSKPQHECSGLPQDEINEPFQNEAIESQLEKNRDKKVYEISRFFIKNYVGALKSTINNFTCEEEIKKFVGINSEEISICRKELEKLLQEYPKHNRMQLYKLITNKKLNPIFQYFLIKRVYSWIFASSKMQDKRAHLMSRKNFLYLCQHANELTPYNFRIALNYK